MPRPVRFEVLCLPNVPWDVLVERVVRLEQLGIEVAALPDHFVDWTNPPSPWFESWTALTGLAGATSIDPARDLRDPDPVPEPGRLRPGGDDPRPRLARPPRDRPRDRARRRSVVPDGRRRGLGAEGARRAPGRIRRDRRPAPARRGDHVRGPLLRRRRGDHEPAAGPVTATADHDRRPRAGDDAPRRPPGRHVEQPVLPRRVRGPGRRDAKPAGGDGRRCARRSGATRPRWRARTRCTTRAPGHAAACTTTTSPSTASRRWPGASSSSGWTSWSSTTRPTTGQRDTFERIATDVLPRLRAGGS